MTQDRSAWMWSTACVTFLLALLFVSTDVAGTGTLLSDVLYGTLNSLSAAGHTAIPVARHWAAPVRFFLTLTFAGPVTALILWLLHHKRISFALLFIAAILVFVFALALALHTQYGIFCDISGFIVSMLIGILGAAIGHWMGLRAQYLQLLHCFYGRLAPRQIRAIARHPERICTSGEQRQITTMICTLHSLPAGDTTATDFLTNTDEMLPEITRIIHHYRGLMAPETNGFSACWNMPQDDPRHAEHACAAALAIVRALAIRNRKTDSPDIRIGIAITTGMGVSGTYHIGNRPVYTVRSYSANRCNRLQVLTSVYGIQILIDNVTEALTGQKFAALEIDYRTISPGKTPVHIYALTGDSGTRAGPKFRAMQTLHRQIFQAVQHQDWAQACTHIQHCRKLSGAVSKLYDTYEDRIHYYEKHPLPEDWDGCYRQPLP